MGVTRRLAKLRERHYLEYKELLGEWGHEYSGCDLRVEALKEAADLVNYLVAAGRGDLAEEAELLGDRIDKAFKDEDAS